LKSGYYTTSPWLLGVIYKQEGECIIGFNRHLGLCLVFDAELWGILDGLSLIQKKGYQKVVIHTGNLEVVKAIQDVHLTDFSSALL
ncbi:hypothetical protein Goari_024237, partial [Gossypium aridum]|nr:hypothetical protein [Gossypium aridum]